MLEEKKLIDIFTKAINQNFEANSETISEVAKRCFDVIKKGGVIQLFGARTGEEFVNELFFRAGGLSPFHGIKLVDLLTRGLITQSDIDSGEVYNDLSILKKFESIYKLDTPRCLYFS